MPAYAVTCTLPGSVPRGGGALAPQLRYALPHSIRREDTLSAARPVAAAQTVAQAYALGSSGVTCHPPLAVQRGGAQPAPVRISLPMSISRDATLPAQTGAASPQPEPGPTPATAPAAPRDRASDMIHTLAPIVTRVARGISGAAGYGYMGEDPGGAGLRYGLLGLRLDTGDMGAALSLARDRDPAGFAAALEGRADALMAAATAADPTARKAPAGDALLWEEPWKSLLSRTAGHDIFRAAQNEYAVSRLLGPAADLILAREALASGTALAMALDALAEAGREAGLAAVTAALGTQPVSASAFGQALAQACPPCRLRLEDLARDRALAEWRPEERKAA